MNRLSIAPRGGRFLATFCQACGKATMVAAKILASACLCGFGCRYDGHSATIPLLRSLYATGILIPVCPECDGGLPVPRPACEIRWGRVVDKKGHNYVASFRLGAEKTLETARKYSVSLAILKDKSPSCGSTSIYDGSFSGTLIKGQGLAAELCSRNGITVLNECNFLDHPYVRDLVKRVTARQSA